MKYVFYVSVDFQCTKEQQSEMLRQFREQIAAQKFFDYNDRVLYVPVDKETARTSLEAIIGD
jgi:hypothetical protein